MKRLIKQVMAEHDDVLDETGDCALCSLVAWVDRAYVTLGEVKGFIKLTKEHTPELALSALDTIAEELEPLLVEQQKE